MLEGCSADAVFLLREVEMGLEEPELFLEGGGSRGSTLAGFLKRVLSNGHPRAC